MAKQTLAHWIDKDGVSDFFYCTNCNYKAHYTELHTDTCPNCKAKISGIIEYKEDSDMKYQYYWYYHMVMSKEQADLINEAIKNHNWDAFCIAKGIYETEWFKKSCNFKDPAKVIFFPDVIYKIEEDGEGEHIPLNEETFKLITDSEYECG